MPAGQLPTHSQGSTPLGQDIVKPMQTKVPPTTVHDELSPATSKNGAPFETTTKDTSPVARVPSGPMFVRSRSSSRFSCCPTKKRCSDERGCCCQAIAPTAGLGLGFRLDHGLTGTYSGRATLLLDHTSSTYNLKLRDHRIISFSQICLSRFSS